MFFSLLSTALSVFIAEVLFIGLLILVSKKSDSFCHAPGLDVAIGILTWVPWVVTFFGRGGEGLFGCVLGQLAVLSFFCHAHTALRGYRGPTIRATLDQIVGRRKNHLGLICTLPALPVFLAVRAAQVLLYPLLMWTMKFPGYKQGDWIQVSRQKFKGLVGHDLIWCLYCDWMTGLYSLGGEMLRNLESMWCPIRFYPDKKCENCQVDFPDVKEWVKADGSIEEVNALLKEKYPVGSKKPNAWFGHPSRKDSQ